MQPMADVQENQRGERQYRWSELPYHPAAVSARATLITDAVP